MKQLYFEEKNILGLAAVRNGAGVETDDKLGDCCENPGDSRWEPEEKKENEAESRNIWVVKQQDLVISWAFVTGLSFRMPMN